jgi:hypothetical protein
LPTFRYFARANCFATRAQVLRETSILFGHHTQNGIAKELEAFIAEQTIIDRGGMGECLGQKVTVGKLIVYYLLDFLQNFLIHLSSFLARRCEQVTKTADVGDFGNRLVLY